MNKLVFEMQIDNQDNKKLTIKTYLAITQAKNQKETHSKYIFYIDLNIKTNRLDKTILQIILEKKLINVIIFLCSFFFFFL